MEKRKGKDNVQSLFQANKIPSDNQIRNLLDPITPNTMTPVFESIFDRLHSQDYLERYRSIIRYWLLSMTRNFLVHQPSIVKNTVKRYVIIRIIQSVSPIFTQRLLQRSLHRINLT